MAHIHDLVLIYLEDKPISFARIERIDPDVKAGWFRVKLFILQVPLQSVTWILRDTYIDGVEFTMSGKRMRIERVVCPEDDTLSADESTQPPSEPPPSGAGAKVIDMKSLLKKR
jgi:hypothetical protein